MARGEHFNHKRKGHPGEFPKDTLTETHAKEAIGDEEFLVVREAFKNRVEEEDGHGRGDTARLLPEEQDNLR